MDPGGRTHARVSEASCAEFRVDGRRGRALSSGRFMNSLVSLRWLVCLLLVVACDEDDADTTVENVEVTPPETIEPVRLSGVDTSNLAGPGDERLFAQLVTDLLSPCGEPVSVANCVREGTECSRCRPAARYLARLVASGYDRGEIRELYRHRYDDSGLVEIPIGDAPVRGSLVGAPITVIEFSDFECPYCGLAHPVLQRLAREYEGQVRVIFKHYPLPLHEHARPAARAAIAAQRQGKFWEMHDLLFEHQEALTPSDLEGYGRRLGLDLARFRTDMADPEVEQRIDDNRAEGREAGVQGTPSIFVNGRRFEGDFENLSAYVREELDGLS